VKIKRALTASYRVIRRPPTASAGSRLGPRTALIGGGGREGSPLAGRQDSNQRRTLAGRAHKRKCPVEGLDSIDEATKAGAQ
jgi:hypothetical protein